jgi:hypothetical protein
MAGMHSEIEINRPVATVYGFFLDLEENITATDPTVESVVKTTPGPLGAGTTFRIRQPVMGKLREQTVRSPQWIPIGESRWRPPSGRSGRGSA